MPTPTGLSIPASFFRLQEATRAEPFGPPDVAATLKGRTYLELSRLVRLRWLFRLSRGRYATVDPLVRITPRVEGGIEPFRSRCYFPILQRTMGGILRAYHGRLRGVVFFGSAARGALRPTSDLDLGVVAERIPEKIPLDDADVHHAESAADALVMEEWDHSRHYHNPSVLSIPPRAFDTPGRVMLGVLADGVILYDPEGLVREGFARLRRRFREAGVKEYRSEEGRPYWRTGTAFEDVPA